VSSDHAQYEQGAGAFRLCPRAGQKEEFEFARDGFHGRM
jgi:hypothetical protein